MKSLKQLFGIPEEYVGWDEWKERAGLAAYIKSLKVAQK